jgi:predicted outer membrane repeat protein
MVATSLLATSALLGTYLGNPRLGRAYAAGAPCTNITTDVGFDNALANPDCATIEITGSFSATNDPGANREVTRALEIVGIGTGITITGGKGRGVAGVDLNFRLLNFNSPSTLKISNLTIKDFKIAGDGGAILSGYTGTVEIYNSTFSGNTAVGGGGGAIRSASYGTVEIYNSTFSGNTAASGGAINSNRNIEIINSTFSGNTANATIYGGGGAIFVYGTATVTSSTFSSNTATRSGGSIIAYNLTKVEN